MTMATSPTGWPASDAVSWRTLESGLRVARRDGRHVGSVQQGHRWVASDAEGEPIGAFRTLAEAQVAVADPAGHRRPIRTWGGAGAMPALCAFASAALVSAAGWVLAAAVR